MRFVHLKQQVFGKQSGISVDECIRAIGRAIRAGSEAWSWIDTVDNTLNVFKLHLIEYHEAMDKRTVAPKLRNTYLDLRNLLSILGEKVHDFARAFETVAKNCGFEARLVESAIKELEFRANDIETRLRKLLDEAYEAKAEGKLSSVEWAIDHDIPYSVRDKLSKLASIVEAVSRKIRI